MASEIQICNLALSHIGAYSIQTLTGSSKEATECNRLYETIRDSVLADHDWSFARKRQTLALLSDTYEGWDYAYQTPTDCLVPRKLYDASDSRTKLEYEWAASEDLDSRVILTNEEDAILIYTARVEDANLFEPRFIDAFAYRLAADLASPIRGNVQLQQAMLQIYFTFINRAKVISANADQKTQSDASSFTEARA